MEPGTTFRIAGISLALAMSATTAYAQDVRSLGMGGAGVTTGEGVEGALLNPSSLMRYQRAKQRYHFNFGGAGEFRDGAGVIDEVRDNENTLEEIEDEINTIGAQSLTCNPIFDPANTVCLTGTQELGRVTSKVLNSFNTVSGKPVDGTGGGQLAFAVSHLRFPFLVSLGTRVTGAGIAVISEEDQNYAETLIDAVADDQLTVSDIENTASIAFDVTDGTVNISEPDDILNSTASGQALVRTSVTFGIATTLKMGKRDIDVGVLPKFSTLNAGGFDMAINELDDPGFDLADEIEDDEVSESSFTFDAGVSLQPTDNAAMRVGAVLRNVVPESIESERGVKFESTTQLIVSGAYQFSRILATADLALNEAKYDNFETQRLNLGAEFSHGIWGLRAGLQNDFAASQDPTSFTLGLGIGPVDFAFSLNGSNISGGLQLAFSL